MQFIDCIFVYYIAIIEKKTINYQKLFYLYENPLNMES